MQNEILDLAKKLIGFKTITSNAKEAGACYDFIKSYFAPEIAAGKIIAKEYNNGGFRSLIFSNADALKFDVILNGHIDVVGAEDKDFIPVIKDGRLYARGAADMKSEVAIMMAVFKESINDSANFNKKIALMLTSDEEIGGKSGVNHLLNNIGYKAKIAITPDGGENFELNIKEKGVFWIKVVAEGKPAHGSRPWLGDNAILKLFDFYREIEKKFPLPGKSKALYKDGISVNLGKIQGGKSVNAVPNSAEMYLDFRYSERSDKNKILAVVKKLARKHESSFEIIEDAGVAETGKENYYLKMFKKITEKEISRKMKIIRSTGSSGTHFFSQKNIPVIVTAPNYGNIHGAGEWVEIGDLEKFYRIIKQFIISPL